MKPKLTYLWIGVAATFLGVGVAELLRWLVRVLFVLFVFSVPSLTAQNVVPVQANTNGVLLSPSPFLRTNITGAGNISVLRSQVGNGIIISNTAGDVTLGQLSSVSNILRTNFVYFDSITSNYLYTLIVGGGAGEVNLNANAGLTNSTMFGLVNPKVGVTNFLKTFQPGYGLFGTNQTTNLAVAVNGEVIPSQPQLNTASNVLRNLILSRPTNTFPASQFTVVGGTQVVIKSAANVTNLNSVGVMSAISILATGTIETDELMLPVVSPGAQAILYVDPAGIVTALQIGSHLSFVAGNLSVTGLQSASLNLTNWSLYSTNVINTKQHGSMTLSNFIAMGITNIIAGTNAVIYTNAGVLVINAVPGGGGSGVVATNANQFGPSTILTIKDGPLLTNIVSRGTLTGEGALFDTGLTVNGIVTLSNTANRILGMNGDQRVQSVITGVGLTFDGTNLSTEVTTAILNAASNVLRSFTITSDTTTSNSLLATLIANDIVTSNGVVTVLRAGDITSSNGVISYIGTVSNVLDTLARTKQHGTQTLTNFQAMGITNVIAGANVTITTNSGTLVVAAAGGAGSPITTTNFTNNASSWSPPAGTTRIRIRAWGAGGDGSIPSSGPTYANPGTGGGGGGYGESVFAATGASSFDFFVGAPTGSARDTYIRAAGSGVDLMRLAGGTNGTTGAEPPFSGGPGGAIILADWGVAGQMGWQRNDGLFGGQGGGSFGTTGGQGGNDWTPGVAAGFGDGVKGMTPGGGGGGGRATYATTGGVGGLGMIVIESFGSP